MLSAVVSFDPESGYVEDDFGFVVDPYFVGSIVSIPAEPSSAGSLAGSLGSRSSGSTSEFYLGPLEFFSS